MWARSDDPLRDFDRYDYEQSVKYKYRPICTCCGEPCQGETLYQNRQIVIKNEYLTICESCLEDNMYDAEDWDE